MILLNIKYIEYNLNGSLPCGGGKVYDIIFYDIT